MSQKKTAIAMQPKLKFVSTGGVFDYQLGNSAAIVEMAEGAVLIDCGYTVFATLSEKGLLDTPQYLLLTHLHGDHVGSIHPAILHWANRRKKKIQIIYPSDAYKQEMINYFNFFLGDTNNYVDFVSINQFPSLGFVDTYGLHVKNMQSYAYTFNFEDQFIFYSGDLGDINCTKDYLKSIKHNNVIVFHETSFLEGSAHVYYKTLERELRDYNVYAFHCNHKKAPNDCQLTFVANTPLFCI